jgi:geranylgeranyl diphosphate synthase, type II
MTTSLARPGNVLALGVELERLRCRVEAALSQYLPKVEPDPNATCPPQLAMAMRYGVLGGGKRLRSLLCLLACQACGGDFEPALPAACALEMVHAYSLIHDDLPAMDDDDLRRGRPSCHRAFDEATAILAGDGLLTLAFEVIARDVRPEPVAIRCVQILAAAAGPAGMVAGQIADLQAERSLGVDGSGVLNENTLNALEAIHRRKTGELLRASLRMGAAIARASDDSTELLDRYGRAIGLAFQIVDDLLDVEGEETKVGKRVGKDSRSGKWTYPRFLGVDGSRRRARQLAEESMAVLEPLGGSGEQLRSLALALLERDR